MRKESILITGGAGFIGSHTVEQLLEEGHAVRVLDNFSSGKRSNLPDHPRLEIHEGDICKRDDVRAAMQDIDRCLHLAAQVSVAFSLEHPDLSAVQNINGTVNVMHAARIHGIKRLVFASSAAIYGVPQQLPLTEDSAVAPLSPYGLEKSVNEQYAMLMTQLHDMPMLGLRYFNIYGPRQDPKSPYAGVISLFVDRLTAGQAPQIYGDGQQTRDFVFVKDIARANSAALFSTHRGVCNVATGGRVSLLELLDNLQKLLGTSLQAEFLAARAGDIQHSQGCPQRLGEWLNLIPRWSLDEGLKELLQARPSILDSNAI
ncbi:NAD-dependent epimerase/dehydratase family protein [Pistricoccus aurantiacus]|uniref:NAD-dependent epimerase/dehydratase family protein n=1 Tax=Pistricoccus aurantiacus TaxID=1883414 RepID=UPI00363E476B